MSSTESSVDTDAAPPVKATVEEIAPENIAEVAQFMSYGMASARPPEQWERAMNPPWPCPQPNRGFLLRARGHVVGAYLALYSERVIRGERRTICNLGAWCVDTQHRASGLRLVRALLRRRGVTFTDLTANPTVLALNERLGLEALDTATRLVPTMVWPGVTRTAKVIVDHDEMAAVLDTEHRRICRDHLGTAVSQLVLTDGLRTCLVVFRRDVYKRLPVFATVLYVSDRDVFRRVAPAFYRHVLLRRGIAAVLLEERIVGPRPPRSASIGGRPKMFLSEDLVAGDIDYLYSELTVLP